MRRPEWERLLERVESGESDGIVVWHTDRLFRQPRDLERLIDLGEKGFTVAIRAEISVDDPAPDLTGHRQFRAARTTPAADLLALHQVGVGDA